MRKYRSHQDNMMSQIYLSLGTNLGEREYNLQRALEGLERATVIKAVSPIYETEPWGGVEQPNFLNMCVAAETTQTPHGFLTFVKYLEIALGRQSTTRWGPRVIDIDLLFYDDLIIDDEQLIIPHPRIAERAFVLAPLADIAPDLVHPVTGKSVAQMLTAVDEGSVHRLMDRAVHTQPVVGH